MITKEVLKQFVADNGLQHVGSTAIELVRALGCDEVLTEDQAAHVLATMIDLGASVHEAAVHVYAVEHL
jgi:hypothetical protein